MKCKKCNHENPPGTYACEQCGTVFSSETTIVDTLVENKSDPLDFSPGEKFGSRYQIVEEIGKGGMGKVFKARDLELDIDVALKMIKPELSSDPSIVSRFKRELLLAREIVHENVIRIHDLGEIGKVKYISMNYIQGNTLQEILQSTGKLTVEKSIDITKQICSALNAAHKKGIVHRDLKPQNIMIDKKGSAHVLDFGIARSITGSGETEAGMVIGTPDFMSPEQIRGQKVDLLSDIYSLGIIMYEMVTGELPFRADNPTSLLYLHLNQEPVPPSQLNPRIPKKLEKIILKCMKKKKTDRYRSLEMVLEAIGHGKAGKIRLDRQAKKSKTNIPHQVFDNGPRRLKYILGIVIPLLVLYASVSVIGLVNDSNFGVKLEKIKVEDETYYKNRYPIQKNWLPAGMAAKDCNAWTTYENLFAPAPSPALPPGDAANLRAISAGKNYSDGSTLRRLVGRYRQNVQFERLFDAGQCNELDSSNLLKTGTKLDLELVRQYGDIVAVEARLDFLEGRGEEAYQKIHGFMVFCLDLLASSTNLEQDRAALVGFQNMCRELIPVLAVIKTGNSYSARTLSVNDPLETAPLIMLDGTEPEKVEDLEPQAPPLPRELVETIKKVLDKLRPDTLFYKEYLNLARRYEDIFEAFSVDKTAYYIVGKLRFWDDGFSIRRYFYNKGIQFYRGLFEGLKYIHTPHDQVVFIHDYYQKHGAGENIVSPTIPQAAFETNTTRLLAKTVLLMDCYNTYGPDSKEFAELKPTDLYINEFTGKPFVITGNSGNTAIEPFKGFKIGFEIPGYAREHRGLIGSLSALTTKSAQEIYKLYSTAAK